MPLDDQPMMHDPDLTVRHEAIESEPAISDLSDADIHQMFGALQESIARLQYDFETKIKYDQDKERMIDTLREQVIEYREDLALKIMRPFINDLIRLYDDLHKTDREQREHADGQALSHLMTGFCADIEEMLSRNGFEVFELTEPEFDSAQQRAQQTIQTTDPALDRQVANHVRKGVRYNQRVIRPEVVTVYGYSPAASTL